MKTLCIDAGTTVIKTVAYDEEGRQVAIARRDTKVSRPLPGHSEQDMVEVWEAVRDTIGELAGELKGDITLVSLTGQGDGCWLVDERGHPTGPAILWNDGRGAVIVEEWRRSGILEEAFRINGSLGFSGLPHAILSWMKANDPARLESSRKALCCDGWLFYRLTGSMVADLSDASVPFLDLGTLTYSEELLGLYNLEWASRLLPDVVRDDDRVGRLSDDAAYEVGLPEGLPVVLAPYDIAATAIGVGAVSPGGACSILGTTLCTETVIDQVDTDGRPSGLTIPLGIPDLYLRAFPTLAGTEVIGWALGLLGLDTPQELTELAAQAPPGAAGLIALPYLSPAGERAPFLDSAARGSLVGLELDHDRTHVARAVLEGLTMVIRDCLEAVGTRPERLGLSGGGASNELWCQLIADVTDTATIRTSDIEVGAKGGVGLGVCLHVSGKVNLDAGVEGEYRSDGAWYVLGEMNFGLQGKVSGGVGIDDACIEESASFTLQLGAEAQKGFNWNTNKDEHITIWVK